VIRHRQCRTKDNTKIAYEEVGVILALDGMRRLGWIFWDVEQNKLEEKLSFGLI
jgi:hypothetical protein